MNRRIFKSETTPDGEIPFYKIGTFGKAANAFITKEKFEEYKQKYPYPQIGDTLISASGSIGRTVVYEGEDAYYQDSNIVWLKHNGKIDNTFLNQFYNVVKWSGIEGTTIKRLYNKDILETKITLPNIVEQKKIGFLLYRIDSAINLHQRKYVNLVKLKNVYLKKIFNQQLVFEDGKNDWKEIKFNEFMYRPKNLLKAKNIGKNELLTVKLFGKGITIANQNRALKLGATTYYKRYAGDFIYGKQNFFNGAFGFIDKNLDGYYSSGDVPTLKFNSEIIDRYFFLSYISRENYYKRTEAYSSGTGSKRIHEDTLLDFKIKAPIISEQRKIANLMCEIDDLVNDYSQRLKYLSDIKSLYINKMFI